MLCKFCLLILTKSDDFRFACINTMPFLCVEQLMVKNKLTDTFNFGIRKVLPNEITFIILDVKFENTNQFSMPSKFFAF